MNSNQWLCREARLDDLPRIVEFQLEMALETEGLKLDLATCTQGVDTVLRNAHLGKYYLVEKAGDVLASLLIIQEWSDWRNGSVWWIHSVYVIPSERRKGIFSFFYQTIQKKCEELGNFRGLRLYVDKRNTRAQKVYQGLGMTNHHYELYEWMKDI